jgi:hypothetical protein
MYQFYITDLESRFGAYAEGLSEQLEGLGRAYQEQGLHKEAVKVFKRAVHLSRINNGLYSTDQIPLLQKLISSYVAAGEYDKADERQYYLYRVQRRAFRSDVAGMADAMLQQAEWERQAYYLAIGDTSFKRLLAMSELYYTSIGQIASIEGAQSAILVDPLKGLLQTQYLIAGYEGESASQFSFSGGGNDQSTAEQNRFAVLRMRNYRDGHEVINALRKVYTHNEPETSSLPATTLIMQGDWSMKYQKRDTAMGLYGEAWEQLAALDDGAALLQQHFGNPLMLPALVGIDAEEDLKSPPKLRGYATVSFGVNTKGRVVNLDLLEKQPLVEGDDKTATRLLRSIRAKTFRPRFEAGQPVATENMVRQYAY